MTTPFSKHNKVRAARFFNSLPSKKHVSLQMNNLLIIGHIKCPNALAGMWTASHGLYGFSFPMTSKCTLLNFSILNRSHHRCRWATQLKSCLISEDSQPPGCLLCRGFQLCARLLKSPKPQWVWCSHIQQFSFFFFSPPPTYKCFQYILNQIQQIIVHGRLLLHGKTTLAKQNRVGLGKK